MARPLAANLDHVALAFHRAVDAWPRLAGDLAGAWVSGGDNGGFYSAQVRFTGGMKVEVLEARSPDPDQFLRRFVERSGPGPHHVTFKVPDITAALDAATAAGFDPVNVDLSDPEWKEGFLHPKQAFGIVVQLAESHTEWDAGPETELPAPTLDDPAEMVRVVQLVADRRAARGLFRDLLGGQPPAGDGGDGDLVWPSGGRIRLVEPEPGTPGADWLGDRPGRVHHLAFRVPDPQMVPDAKPLDGGRAEVPPEANHGTRLIVEPARP